MTEACKADPRGGRAQTCYYAVGTAPTKFCKTHVLVEYDSKTKAVACSGCPKEDIKKVGLLDIPSRSFPRQVSVTDAQYMYHKMKDGVQMSTDNNQPYFANSLEGKFTGKTRSGVQYNHACDVHLKNPYVPETTNNDTTVALPPTIETTISHTDDKKEPDETTAP